MRRATWQAVEIRDAAHWWCSHLSDGTLADSGNDFWQRGYKNVSSIEQAMEIRSRLAISVGSVIGFLSTSAVIVAYLR